MEFKDRVPTYPNRKKITYEDGRVEYVTIEYADEPVEVGTPINKATLEALQNTAVPVVGTYVGNGDASQEISLGFRPSVVAVIDPKSTGSSPLVINKNIPSVKENGFIIAIERFNILNREYTYMAWRDIDE